MTHQRAMQSALQINGLRHNAAWMSTSGITLYTGFHYNPTRFIDIYCSQKLAIAQKGW